MIAAGTIGVLRPLVGHAQQRQVRIGYVANDPNRTSPTFAAFAGKLRELGWIEGKNLVIDIQNERFDPKSKREVTFAEIAAEFARAKVDVMVTTGTGSTKAAIAATKTIPIVFGSAQDPVQNGFVASLARPGGNLTGLALAVQELGPKRLELLTDALPRATRFGRLFHEGATKDILQAKIEAEDNEAARRREVERMRRVTLEHIPVSRNVTAKSEESVIRREFDSLFGAIKARGIEGVYVKADALHVVKRELIGELGLKHRLPIMGADARFADAGTLLSYGEDFVSRYQKAAVLVDKILRGANPSDLPVEESLKPEFVINMKTAKFLGIPVPELLRLRADRIIE